MSINSSAATLDNGGLYILLFLRADPGTFHWALYLHRETTVSKSNTSEAVKYISHGTKYHIRSMGPYDDTWIADHGETTSIVNSIFLIVLVRIGLIHEESFDAVNTIIKRRDNSLNSTPTTCRLWTMAIIHDLCATNHLKLRSGLILQHAENEIRHWGDSERDAAMNNEQPRVHDLLSSQSVLALPGEGDERTRNCQALFKSITD